MRNVYIHLKYARRLFGFSRSGASIVGRYARKWLVRKEVGHAAKVFLIAASTASILIHTFSNIGGNLTLALDMPKATIDATTKASVQLPIEFNYESRGFSWYHPGVDLVAPTGTDVRPIMVGVVETVSYDRFGYGNHVIIKHEGGYESLYGHLSEPEVQPGQNVSLDTEIGKSGSTGFSTGPHLHLEVYKDSVPIDPADVVPGVH